MVDKSEVRQTADKGITKGQFHDRYVNKVMLRRANEPLVLGNELAWKLMLDS